MLIIILTWVFLFVVIILVGKLLINNKLLSFLNIGKSFEWYEYFWGGFAIVLAILQIWSIFFPVNIYALAFIVILSLVSTALLLRKKIKIPKIGVYFFLVIGVLLFIISYFASLSVSWPDTQGYHLNAVKWTNLYSVVPGLANLHTRLGFNSSFFLFASTIDSILKDRSSHIALSFMTSVLFVEYVWIFVKSKNIHLKVFLSLTLPLIIVNIIRTGQISSLSYDFALLLIILAICIELIQNNKKSFFVAGVLSIILLTIKISGAAFSLVVLCFIAYQLILKNKINIRMFWFFLVLTTVLLLPYIVRNVILTGWPFYPIPIFDFKVAWSVPFEKVKGLFETIKAWAILPGENYPQVIGVPLWKWLPNWIIRNGNSFELRSFVLSTLTIIALFVFKFVNQNKIKQNIGFFITMFASLVGILYLILSAPDFRFGSVFFWIFFASVISLFFVVFLEKYPKFQKIYFIFPLLLIYYIAWPPKFDGEIMLKSIRWEQSLTSKKIEIKPNDGSAFFSIYVPDMEVNDSCGNSLLPCTPEYKNKFKEIVPGDISKGFVPLR